MLYKGSISPQSDHYDKDTFWAVTLPWGEKWE